MSYDVKSVVHISLFLTVAKDFHQLFKNISYFTQEDEEDEEQLQDYYYYAFTITMQKLRLKMFLRFISKQTYRIFLFLYILFAIHHSLRCWYLLFKLESGSTKISFLVFRGFLLIVVMEISIFTKCKSR